MLTTAHNYHHTSMLKPLREPREGVEQHEENLRGYQFLQERVSTPQSTSRPLPLAVPAWRRAEERNEMGRMYVRTAVTAAVVVVAALPQLATIATAVRG